MITLYAFGPAFGLPDPSPFVMKTAIHLQMAGLPYRTDLTGFPVAPKGKLPYINDGGEIVADSTFIRAHIERKYGVDLDDGLSARQRAEAWAIERMLEDHLVWVAGWFRWMIEENFRSGPAHFFDKAPEFVRARLLEEARTKVKQAYWSHGIGRHSPEEIAELGGRSLTALAAALGERAGKARGTAPAARTSQEQFRSFGELSTQTWAEAERALALAPDDPVPCNILLIAMFGDAGRRGAFREILAEARRRERYSFEVNSTAVTFLCEKWFGSHDAMFAAARETASEAPAGTGVTMLPLLAHLEYAMREYSWGKVSARGLVDCQNYFRRPDVQRELDACVTKWRSPGPPTHAKALTCENWLALAYALSGRRDECKAVFDRIGPHVDSYTWSYFYGNVVGGFKVNWAWANRVR